MSTYDKVWFSAAEISLLGNQLVAGLPKTESGSRRHIEKDGWASREVKGGGGPGGMRTEYQPPAAVLALIQSYLAAHPEFFPKNKVRIRDISLAETLNNGQKSLAERLNSPLASSLNNATANNGNSVIHMAGAHTGDVPACGSAINSDLMALCHSACRKVYGETFDALTAAIQLGYVVDLYNLLVKMSAQNGGLDQMKRLEITGLVEQLTVFKRLGWAKHFPPPEPIPWHF